MLLSKSDPDFVFFVLCFDGYLCLCLSSKQKQFMSSPNQTFGTTVLLADLNRTFSTSKLRHNNCVQQSVFDFKRFQADFRQLNLLHSSLGVQKSDSIPNCPMKLENKDELIRLYLGN